MDGKSFETTLPCVFQGNYSVSAKSPGETFQELIFLCICLCTMKDNIYVLPKGWKKKL